MAITKKHKEELISKYKDWLNRSQVTIVAQYVGLSVKNMEELRRVMREKGAEFHVAKNTLLILACKEIGITVPQGLLEGSTAVGFAFTDAAATAKSLMDFARTSDLLKVKGGFMGQKPISAENVKALADLPPLPVVRAQLIGTIQAPATKMARLLVEPGRQIAAVIQAHSAGGE